MRRMATLFVSVLLLGAAEDVPSPVSVRENKIQRLNETQHCVVSFSNSSQKSIIGYVIRFQLLGGKGERLENVTFSGVSYDPNVERKKPGDVWELSTPAQTSDAQPRPAVTCDPQIDYVLFADLTSWGPNQSGRGHMILSEFQGAKGERARLRSILQEKGVAELVKTLETPEWPRRKAN